MLWLGKTCHMYDNKHYEPILSMIGDIRKEVDFLKLLLTNAHPAPVDVNTHSAENNPSGTKVPEMSNLNSTGSGAPPEPTPDAGSIQDVLESSIISLEAENMESEDHLNC